MKEQRIRQEKKPQLVFRPRQDYRTILRCELERRCQLNPRYSLRAFARDIQLSPSRLSEVLSGAHGLSAVKANTIAERLGYNLEEKKHFCALVESRHARGEFRKSLADKTLDKHYLNKKNHFIELDSFELISNWYHFAALCLFHLPDFEATGVSVSKRLDISLGEAEGALERLVRVGMLKKDKRGTFILTEASGSTPTDVPSQAIRSFHRQILNRAVQALEIQSLDEREFQSAMIAVDPALVPEAKRRVKQFSGSFCNWVEKSSKKKESVYNLSMQLFRITTKKGDTHVE